MLITAIQKFDQLADGDSNDVEHEAAAELRDAAAALVGELLAAHDPDNLLDRIRTEADNLQLANPGRKAAAAEAMRAVFLDLDDFLCRGNQPPQEWLSAWTNTARPQPS
jgi:hypothetical protein